MRPHRCLCALRRSFSAGHRGSVQICIYMLQQGARVGPVADSSAPHFHLYTAVLRIRSRGYATLATFMGSPFCTSSSGLSRPCSNMLPLTLASC